MYIAALRIADQFGCDIIGIQYQQGLKDLAPASDLVEGLLNNVDRPPVRDLATGKDSLREPGAAPLQRSGRVRRLGRAGHQSRLAQAGLRSRDHAARRALRRELPGERQGRVRVGVRDLRRRSAAAPHRRLRRRRSATASLPCTSPPAAARVKGISKPGEIVWSRVFVENGALKADLGRARVRRAAARRERAPLALHHAAVAHDARGHPAASRATSSWPGTRPTTFRSPTPRTPRAPIWRWR